MQVLPPTRLWSLHVMWEAVWRYRAWQNGARAAGQYRMTRTPWRQRWSGCLSYVCDGWRLFCQTQCRWSISWRHFLLHQAASKHKKTHFLTILSSLNRTFLPVCCQLVLVPLTLTLRVSLQEDSLSGVVDRTLLMTVGIPEDSNSPELSLQPRKMSKNIWISRCLKMGGVSQRDTRITQRIITRD